MNICDSVNESESDEENQEELKIKKSRMRKREGQNNLKINKDDTREDITEKFNEMKKELKNMKGDLPLLSFHIFVFWCRNNHQTRVRGGQFKGRERRERGRGM